LSVFRFFSFFYLHLHTRRRWLGRWLMGSRPPPAFGLWSLRGLCLSHGPGAADVCRRKGQVLPSGGWEYCNTMDGKCIERRWMDGYAFDDAAFSICPTDMIYGRVCGANDHFKDC